MNNIHGQEMTGNDFDDSLHEECGVFGIYDFDGGDVASTIYYGLFALQHRGQESCGIAVSDTFGPKGRAKLSKGMGLVNEVFTPEDIESLKGNIPMQFQINPHNIKVVELDVEKQSMKLVVTDIAMIMERFIKQNQVKSIFNWLQNIISFLL